MPDGVSSESTRVSEVVDRQETVRQSRTVPKSSHTQLCLCTTVEATMQQTGHGGMYTLFQNEKTRREMEKNRQKNKRQIKIKRHHQTPCSIRVQESRNNTWAKSNRTRFLVNLQLIMKTGNTVDQPLSVNVHPIDRFPPVILPVQVEHISPGVRIPPGHTSPIHMEHRIAPIPKATLFECAFSLRQMRRSGIPSM